MIKIIKDGHTKKLIKALAIKEETTSVVWKEW